MRRTRVIGAALLAALAAAAMVVSMGFGSSHREAPGILNDPTADNTDVYAFTAKDAPGSLTVVANWIPLEEPAGGPYYGKLDPKARYYVKIDNTGDGYEDVAYRWQFHSEVPQPELVPVRGADGDVGQRSGHQLRPDVRPVQGDVRGQPQAQADPPDRPQRAGRPGQRRAEDDPELRPRRGSGPSLR